MSAPNAALIELRLIFGAGALSASGSCIALTGGIDSLLTGTAPEAVPAEREAPPAAALPSGQPQR